MTIATGSISVAKGQPLWISEEIFFLSNNIIFFYITAKFGSISTFFKDFFYSGGFHLKPVDIHMIRLDGEERQKERSCQFSYYLTNENGEVESVCQVFFLRT